MAGSSEACTPNLQVAAEHDRLPLRTMHWHSRAQYCCCRLMLRFQRIVFVVSGAVVVLLLCCGWFCWRARRKAYRLQLELQELSHEMKMSEAQTQITYFKVHNNLLHTALTCRVQDWRIHEGDITLDKQIAQGMSGSWSRLCLLTLAAGAEGNVWLGTVRGRAGNVAIKVSFEATVRFVVPVQCDLFLVTGVITIHLGSDRWHIEQSSAVYGQKQKSHF